MQLERVAEVRDWTDRARLDLRAAERLLADDSELAEPALYHCQQAAEKILKAYLVWHDRPFAKTHNLVLLLNLCITIAPEFSELEDAANTLTPYAVAFRYPGEDAEPTTDEVEDALQFTRHMFSFVSNRLPPEALSKGQAPGERDIP
jgi:HEPN domain-containing protein